MLLQCVSVNMSTFTLTAIALDRLVSWSESYHVMITKDIVATISKCINK